MTDGYYYEEVHTALALHNFDTHETILMSKVLQRKEEIKRCCWKINIFLFLTLFTNTC